ncbi:KilA-N domain-containing protein [Hyphomicrobium sp. CS1BSMeth3]|uniref:KilA-N domain-containing protein n=1 Tax=Hyphomicrobium sp. CS1BSMeth3 TaxID=1892844 RepID=UPI0009314ACE|nr:KilA-N domain-containing protein [Hyphomicrobium sp. CS1BSMeth3]
MTAESYDLTVLNKRIGTDSNGNICLNDLWSVVDEPANKRPNDWNRGKRAKALQVALEGRITENFRNSGKAEAISTYYVSGRGRASKTYAHPVLALDYAEYLDPRIGVEVREVFLRYRADDISLANDILDRIAEQAREDEMRLHIRGEITLRNKELAGEGKKAGCQGWEYAELHNSGYRGLYSGLDEGGIHRLKKLTKHQKILDHMTAAEGAANLFRITQAKLAMEAKRPRTPQQAFGIAHEAGVETRKAMERIGGVMPEDLPVADSIKDAKKRLAANLPLLGKK